MIDHMGIFRTDVEIASVTQQHNRLRLGEMSLLGAHGLEGMNLRVDFVRRELIPAGPVPVASAA